MGVPSEMTTKSKLTKVTDKRKKKKLQTNFPNPKDIEF